MLAGTLVAGLVAGGVWLVAARSPEGRSPEAGSPEARSPEARSPDDQVALPRRAPLRIGLPINPAELDPAGLAGALDLARRAGATEVTAGVAWWYASRGRPDGSYDWTAVDRLVTAARARGMQVRLQLSGTPDAVHPDLARSVPDPGHRVWYPPRTPAQLRAWGQFVHATVGHFAGRVSSFQMWNEPNIETFWKPVAAPDEYARLLAEGYRSAKRASPTAQVVFGGLSHNDIGYLQRYYADVRRLFPDAAEHRYFFDKLDVHPYTHGRSPDETSTDAALQGRFGAVDRTFAGLQRMKTVMDRNEGGRAAGDKAILVGEFGYSTGRRRAYYLKRAVALAGELPFVASFYWYGFLSDSGTVRGWAIVTEQQPPSWTYLALEDLATGRGPTVRLPDPAALRPNGRPIEPLLVGLDPRDVSHSELYVDGVLGAEADGPAVRWTGPAPRSGECWAQIVVYTRDHHAWPSEIITLRTGTD
jgi:hypothetical protein